MTEPILSKQKKFHKFAVRGCAKQIIFSLILVFALVRPFIVEAYRIPSGSMEDTLLIGDQILVCKFIYGIKIPGTNVQVFDFHKPARGDVFVFIPPHVKTNNISSSGSLLLKEIRFIPKGRRYT